MLFDAIVADLSINRSTLAIATKCLMKGCLFSSEWLPLCCGELQAGIEIPLMPVQESSLSSADFLMK